MISLKKRTSLPLHSAALDRRSTVKAGLGVAQNSFLLDQKCGSVLQKKQQQNIVWYKNPKKESEIVIQIWHQTYGYNWSPWWLNSLKTFLLRCRREANNLFHVSVFLHPPVCVAPRLETEEWKRVNAQLKELRKRGSTNKTGYLGVFLCLRVALDV